MSKYKIRNDTMDDFTCIGICTRETLEIRLWYFDYFLPCQAVYNIKAIDNKVNYFWTSPTMLSLIIKLNRYPGVKSYVKKYLENEFHLQSRKNI